jgi:hypothetical protein
VKEFGHLLSFSSGLVVVFHVVSHFIDNFASFVVPILLPAKFCYFS